MRLYVCECIPQYAKWRLRKPTYCCRFKLINFGRFSLVHVSRASVQILLKYNFNGSVILSPLIKFKLLIIHREENDHFALQPGSLGYIHKILWSPLHYILYGFDCSFPNASLYEEYRIARKETVEGWENSIIKSSVNFHFTKYYYVIKLLMCWAVYKIYMWKVIKA